MPDKQPIGEMTPLLGKVTKTLQFLLVAITLFGLFIAVNKADASTYLIDTENADTSAKNYARTSATGTINVTSSHAYATIIATVWHYTDATIWISRSSSTETITPQIVDTGTRGSFIWQPLTNIGGGETITIHVTTAGTSHLGISALLFHTDTPLGVAIIGPTGKDPMLNGETWTENVSIPQLTEPIIRFKNGLSNGPGYGVYYDDYGGPYATEWTNGFVVSSATTTYDCTVSSVPIKYATSMIFVYDPRAEQYPYFPTMTATSAKGSATEPVCHDDYYGYFTPSYSTNGEVTIEAPDNGQTFTFNDGIPEVNILVNYTAPWDGFLSVYLEGRKNLVTLQTYISRIRTASDELTYPVFGGEIGSAVFIHNINFTPVVTYTAKLCRSTAYNDCIESAPVTVYLNNFDENYDISSGTLTLANGDNGSWEQIYSSTSSQGSCAETYKTLTFGLFSTSTRIYSRVCDAIEPGIAGIKAVGKAVSFWNDNSALSPGNIYDLGVQTASSIGYIVGGIWVLNTIFGDSPINTAMFIVILSVIILSIVVAAVRMGIAAIPIIKKINS